MKPVILNGILWRVVRVKPGHPSLIDRTMSARIATTEPSTHTIYIRQDVVPPLLDKVLLHEVTHAITMSYNLLDALYQNEYHNPLIQAEEWSAQLVELFSLEAITISTEILGRPLCIRGICVSR